MHNITRSLLLLSFLIFFAACQTKNESWFVKNLPDMQAQIMPDAIMRYDSATLQNQVLTLKNIQRQLKEVNLVDFSAEKKAAFLDFKNQVNLQLYASDTLKIQYWNPAIYRINAPIQATLNNKDKTAEENFTIINEILGAADNFYQIAKTNLAASIDTASAQQAIDEHSADFLFFKNELPSLIQTSNISTALKNNLLRNLEQAPLIIKDYIGYVTSLVNNLDDLDNQVKIIDGKAKYDAYLKKMQVR